MKESNDWLRPDLTEVADSGADTQSIPLSLFTNFVTRENKGQGIYSCVEPFPAHMVKTLENNALSAVLSVVARTPRVHAGA